MHLTPGADNFSHTLLHPPHPAIHSHLTCLSHGSFTACPACLEQPCCYLYLLSLVWLEKRGLGSIVFFYFIAKKEEPTGKQHRQSLFLLADTLDSTNQVLLFSCHPVEHKMVLQHWHPLMAGIWGILTCFGTRMPGFTVCLHHPILWHI